MLETIITSLLVVKNVLYFITGGWLFFIAAASLPKATRHMDSTTEVVAYTFCCLQSGAGYSAN